SADGEDGRTHTTIALAQQLAEMGLRVLVIEGDLRKPTIAGTLSLPEVPGLGDILTKQSSFEGQIHRFGTRDLFVLPAGT
ncbi:tyrosine-protein kinase family protein, partial [Vibrio parahaemolyticus]